MDFRQEIEDLTKNYSPRIGCSENEIQDLEQKFKVTLPDDYKAFLKVCGHSPGGSSYMCGSSYSYSEVLDYFQNEGNELLEESNIEVPDGVFFLTSPGLSVFFPSWRSSRLLSRRQ